MNRNNRFCISTWELTMLVLLLLKAFPCRSEKVYLYDNEIISMVLNSIDTCVSYMDKPIRSSAKHHNIYLNEQGLPLNMPRASVNYEGLNQATPANWKILPDFTENCWGVWNTDVSIDKNRAYVCVDFGYSGVRIEDYGIPHWHIAYSSCAWFVVYYVYDCVNEEWVYEKIRGIGSKKLDLDDWPFEEQLDLNSKRYYYKDVVVEEIVDSIIRKYVDKHDDSLVIFLESRPLNYFQIRDLTKQYENLEYLNFNADLSHEKAKKFFNKDGIIHLVIEYRLWKNKLYFTITESKEKWTSVKNVCKLIEKNDVSTETIEYEYNCDTGEWELCP